MNEYFVTYELAVKLKEKGFKEKCIAYYWEKINEHTPSFLVEDNMPEDGLNILDLLSNHNQAEWSPFIDAPTIPQVLKWLRKKKIVVSILPAGYNKETGLTNYYYVIYDVAEYFWKKNEYPQSFETWEECELSAIEYVLDNLI